MIEAERTSWTDVDAHLRRPGATWASRLAILPFGALEQHGPHLPLGTDTFQAAHIARGIASALDAILLPSVPYGNTWTMAGYPGTLSLAPATVTAIAIDIGRALATAPTSAAGLVIVNGDWGNRMPLARAAATMTSEGLPTLVVDYPELDSAADGLCTSAPAAPGLTHADESETSMMLAIDPALVDDERALAEYPRLPDDFGATPQQLHPFSPSGVFGDATAATADTGRRLLDAVLAASLALVEDFGRR